VTSSASRRRTRPGAERIDPSLTGIPNIGRATVIGALIGAVVVAVPVAALLFALGGGAMTVVFATHVGIFGGMGYGGMVAAVVQADRTEYAERTAVRTSRRLSPNVVPAVGSPGAAA
jgi:hypothetical protein